MTGANSNCSQSSSPLSQGERKEARGAKGFCLPLPIALNVMNWPAKWEGARYAGQQDQRRQYINWRAVGDRGPWVVMTTGGRRGYDEFIPLAEKIARHGFRVMNLGGRFATSIPTATVTSEQMRVSKAKPLRGAEGALDTLICSKTG
ncbi:MAG TPA: hypothetical protein VEK31_09715 [Xanthobacteraceae bacterium]|nr:hypothetical protein [Xanthobacteraceae bacterium]